MAPPVVDRHASSLSKICDQPGHALQLGRVIAGKVNGTGAPSVGGGERQARGVALQQLGRGRLGRARHRRLRVVHAHEGGAAVAHAGRRPRGVVVDTAGQRGRPERQGEDDAGETRQAEAQHATSEVRPEQPAARSKQAAYRM
jgi:hypothetical protein